MKILIYGAGVIGCTYGWQLEKSGHDVSVLVRKNKEQFIEKNGIKIHCTDFRNGNKIVENIVFRPKVISTLSANNDFEYIIITINSLHLEEILPVLKESSGRAHIVFFQNIWQDDLENIHKHLVPEQYFFGFPFMAGGGRDKGTIHSIISGSKYSKTMLGEINGKVTFRIQKIADAMSEAGMKPFISNQIITWLIPHYAFIATLSTGIIKAGGTMKSFLDNPKIVKKTILSIRNSFHICSRIGIEPKREKVNKLYYLPLFISTPIVRKVFSDITMQTMFDGFVGNSANEIETMIKKIMSTPPTYRTNS